MAAHQPEEPGEPLPVGLGTLGTGSPAARPEFGSLFLCVEDAFENKTLQLDTPGAGHRSLWAGEPYSGPRGYPEGTGEPDSDGPGAPESLGELPGVMQGCGPKQVVAAGPWAGAGSLPKSAGSRRRCEG